jgi:hypothetical protein
MRERIKKKRHSCYFERTPNNWKIKGVINPIPLKFTAEIQHTVGGDSSIQIIFKFRSIVTSQSLRKWQLLTACEAMRGLSEL